MNKLKEFEDFTKEELSAIYININSKSIEESLSKLNSILDINQINTSEYALRNIAINCVLETYYREFNEHENAKQKALKDFEFHVNQIAEKKLLLEIFGDNEYLIC